MNMQVSALIYRSSGGPADKKKLTLLMFVLLLSDYRHHCIVHARTSSIGWRYFHGVRGDMGLALPPSLSARDPKWNTLLVTRKFDKLSQLLLKCKISEV